MYTKAQAGAVVAEWTDQQLDAAVVPGKPWDQCSDQEQLAIAAALERVRRKQAADLQARIDAPLIADRARARTVWEAAGSPGDFDSFFAQHQRQDAHDQLDRQRRTAHKLVRF